MCEWRRPMRAVGVAVALAAALGLGGGCADSEAPPPVMRQALRPALIELSALRNQNDLLPYVNRVVSVRGFWSKGAIDQPYVYGSSVTILVDTRGASAEKRAELDRNVAEGLYVVVTGTLRSIGSTGRGSVSKLYFGIDGLVIDRGQ